MSASFDLQMLLSAASFVFTCYFWLVKARRERPDLEFYQLSNFRSSCRRHPDRQGVKRYGLQQLDTGGVLVANHSTRQNSIILFECYLRTESGRIQGDWGYAGDDKPPWNIGPESSIAFSPACFFDVPEELELPENPEFQMRFVTTSGVEFSHAFFKKAPVIRSDSDTARIAA